MDLQKAIEMVLKMTSRELFRAIDEALYTKNYYFTYHGLLRSRQRRNVNELQVIKMLKSKSRYHEKKKDQFQAEFKSWNYAIRGQTIDNENIRIIVSFNEKSLLIITVINLSV